MSSLQHKLDRVRRPRVQITYDVETNGAIEKVELPFVVGVLADLSGMPKDALKPLKERQAVYIDRDNFNNVLAKSAPRLALKVQNRLSDENTKLAVELNFKSMDDFEPAKVAEQVGPLKELLAMRHNLTQLLLFYKETYPDIKNMKTSIELKKKERDRLQGEEDADDPGEQAEQGRLLRRLAVDDGGRGRRAALRRRGRGAGLGGLGSGAHRDSSLNRLNTVRRASVAMMIVAITTTTPAAEARP